MFIREMCLLMGTEHLDACLKGIYKEFSANSKFVSAAAIPRIRFMINCVVELFGIDLAASYQQAFMFIRQLAIVLRNALTIKTKVYVWKKYSELD
jgi:nucleolar complex protein 2